MQFIIGLIATLLEKVGLYWLEEHRAKVKAEDIANTPQTDKEWNDAAKRGDL